MIRQLVAQEFCLTCKGCCRFRDKYSSWSPTLLKEEIEVMVHNGLPPALITQGGKIRIEYFPDQEIYLCSLLSHKDNTCLLYRFRPLECQLYPFLFCRRQDKFYLAVDTHCPYIEVTKDSKEYKEYAASLTQLLMNPIYQRLLRGNLQLFQDYPKVLIVAELELSR